MKRHILTIVLVATGFFTLQAQHYQAFNADRIVCFEGSDTDRSLKFQRVDSVTVESGDSVFWFYPNFDNDDPVCIRPIGENWSGYKMLVRANGDHLFFNKQRDTIVLKTHAGLNTPWQLYSRAGKLTIMGEVVKHDTLSFLGLTDSVKTIGFRVYNGNNELLEHRLNSLHIMLSKEYGILKTLAFKSFPDYTSIERDLYPFTLVGISNPPVGVQNLTYKEVFGDFYPGDELHTVTESCSGGLEESVCSTRRRIERYLSRIDYPDSIVYSVMRITSTYGTSKQGSSYSFRQDTVVSRVIFNSGLSFATLSLEPIVYGDNVSYYEQSLRYIGSGDYVMAKTYYPNYYMYKLDEDCWSWDYVDAMETSYYYLQGFGGSYHYASLWFDYSYESLVYSKKGDVEIGKPLAIRDETTVYDIKENHMRVYPNPARDYVSIDNEKGIPLVFELFDINGRILVSEAIQTSHFTWDVRSLHKGIYLYRVKTEGVCLKSGKLMID